MNLDKINSYLNDENYVKKIIDEYKEKDKEEYKVKLIINGKPEAYARPRVVRGGHAYNPKAKLMDQRNFQLKEQTLFIRNQINDIIKKDNYIVELNLKYYIPIAKNETIKNAILKEKGLIRPLSRPDLDNYDKFIIDVLHDVVYDDDKRVVTVNSEKYYSINPRTEIIATIYYNK